MNNNSRPSSISKQSGLEIIWNLKKYVVS